MRHPYPDTVLGDLARELRLDANVSVVEAATRLGWPIDHLIEVEDGECDLSFVDARRLASSYGLDVAEFGCLFETEIERRHDALGAFVGGDRDE